MSRIKPLESGFMGRVADPMQRQRGSGRGRSRRERASGTDQSGIAADEVSSGRVLGAAGNSARLWNSSLGGIERGRVLGAAGERQRSYQRREAERRHDLRPASGGATRVRKMDKELGVNQGLREPLRRCNPWRAVC